MTVLDLVVTMNELVVTVPDSVMKLVVIDTMVGLFHHCAGLVSQRIMKSAHIVAEYALRTIDDIATTVGSVSYCKVHAQHADYCIHPCCKLASCSHV